MNINIEDIEANMMQRKKWNNLNAKDIKLFRNGQRIKIDDEVLDRLVYAGFHTIDIILLAIEEAEGA